MTLPQIVLAAEFVACVGTFKHIFPHRNFLLERAILSLEFWPWNGIFTTAAHAVLLNFHMSVFTTLLITLYWHQIFRPDSQLTHATQGLRKFKWPFIAYTIGLFVVVILASTITDDKYTGMRFYLYFFAATSLLLAVFYLYTATRLILFISRSISYEKALARKVILKKMRNIDFHRWPFMSLLMELCYLLTELTLL